MHSEAPVCFKTALTTWSDLDQKNYQKRNLIICIAMKIYIFKYSFADTAKITL